MGEALLLRKQQAARVQLTQKRFAQTFKGTACALFGGTVTVTVPLAVPLAQCPVAVEKKKKDDGP